MRLKYIYGCRQCQELKQKKNKKKFIFWDQIQKKYYSTSIENVIYSGFYDNSGELKKG